MVWERPSHLDAYKLTGKVAVITGAGQGIGEASAHALADAGAKIVLVGRSEANLRVVEIDISKKVECFVVLADVSKEDDVIRAKDEVLAKFGQADILINNAGIGQWADVEKISLDDWQKVIASNLTSVFLCSREFGRVMLKNGYGKIVNVSSISARIVNAEHNQAHYNASKAAVTQLTKSMGTEWAKHGVRVNAVSPGYTKTKLLLDLLDTPYGRSLGDAIIKSIPCGEMADVMDVSQAILYLSVHASDYITASDLTVDGGFTAW